MDRRLFLRTSGVVLSAALLPGCVTVQPEAEPEASPAQYRGPGARYTPQIQAAFVRRKGEYGMLWPGAVYDGQAGQARYRQLIFDTAKNEGIALTLREEPLYTIEETKAWLAEAKAQSVDGLVLILLDRQQHAWPSASLAAESDLPSVIFSPLGSSFTTNTIHLAEKTGCFISCTIDDFSQAAYGMRMLKARAKLQRARCVVIQGTSRRESQLSDLGITLCHIPAQDFLDTYQNTPTSPAIEAMAKDYIRHAKAQRYATVEDVIHGIKSFWVAQQLLEREQGDGITMDCLGALGPTNISLPCIAWSKMNDVGIPAACEADLGAVASHFLVHYLFDRPGFQQDPVADTQDDALIGAHCSCPTRLNGYDEESEPFEIIHHHGNRDAVPRTLWKIGQRITCLDVLPGDLKQNQPTELLVSAGTVLDNLSVPPAGGCVVSVKAKFDGKQPVLSFPGFHQLFFYGDYKKELLQFSQLMGFRGTEV
jgi:hypothetical protein